MALTSVLQLSAPLDTFVLCQTGQHGLLTLP